MCATVRDTCSRKPKQADGWRLGGQARLERQAGEIPGGGGGGTLIFSYIHRLGSF